MEKAHGLHMDADGALKHDHLQGKVHPRYLPVVLVGGATSPKPACRGDLMSSTGAPLSFADASVIWCDDNIVEIKPG
jgi:hypothetical protein